MLAFKPMGVPTADEKTYGDQWPLGEGEEADMPPDESQLYTPATALMKDYTPATTLTKNCQLAVPMLTFKPMGVPTTDEKTYNDQWVGFYKITN
ncbi:hypothetical protein K438DRAFT_2010772 [Mycena galopus ATCC 62051]|nr:hypothetical protein K438DRAFT_2010772 [Mycena galopus ATCC 62051]